MLIVLLFVMVDLIILTIVTAIDTARYTARIVPDKENPAIMTVSQLRFGGAQLNSSYCYTCNSRSRLLKKHACYSSIVDNT